MCLFFMVFSAAVVFSTTAQIHGTGDNAMCFQCDDDHDASHFPGCLKRPVRCGPDQVCRIRHGYRMGGHVPHIGCFSKSQCNKEIGSHSMKCAEGGVLIRHGYCQACCDDDQCVTGITDVLQLEVISSANLFCPHRCHVDDLKQCVDNGVVCDHGDYCENKTSYGGTSHAHCFSDCCTNNLCLFKHFGIHLANASIPSSLPTPDAGPMGGQGSDLWNKLHDSCVDSFSNVTCEGLKNDSDLCHNRLSLSVCPKTCGICDALGGSVCVDNDTVKCVENKNLSSTFCATDTAVFTCPKTCNLCDKLLDSIIVSLIDGTSEATQVPPSLLSSPDPSTSYPTVNCTDLAEVTCEHLVPVCLATFLNVVCPDECDACNF